MFLLGERLSQNWSINCAFLYFFADAHQSADSLLIHDNILVQDCEQIMCEVRTIGEIDELNT